MSGQMAVPNKGDSDTLSNLPLKRRTSGEDRDQARVHLLELFSVLDPEDERVLAGRRSLANALY